VQVGEYILDFFPLIELDAVDDLVGESAPSHGMLERPRQRVHPEEHGEITGLSLVIQDRMRDLLRDVIGFGLAVAIALEHHRFPFGVGRKQLLVFAATVVPDQLVGDPQDVWRAAIVLLEPHRFDVGIILFEVEDVVQIGSSPPIN